MNKEQPQYSNFTATIKDEEDYRINYQMPWDIIKDTESNWSHTELDKIEEVARSNSSVVFKLLMRRINKSVLKNASEPILGMVKTVSHLVKIEEVK